MGVGASAAHAGDFTLDDGFAGSTLDPDVWNTSIATSGNRFCSESGPWRDVINTTDCDGYSTTDHGSVTVSGGRLELANGFERSFPFIYSKPGTFPETGNFRVSVTMGLVNAADNQNGFSVVDWSGDTSDASTDSVLTSANRVLLVRGNSWATEVSMFGTLIHTFTPTGDVTYTLTYDDGYYSLEIDGVRVGPTVESDVRPNSLTLGNSAFTPYFSPVDWSDLSVDQATVEELDPVSLPGLTDDFDGSSLDTDIWDDTIATSGTRFCGDSTGPWVDLATTGCNGNNDTTHGTLDVVDGRLEMRQASGRSFPFIHTQPGVIPPSGNFSVSVRMRLRGSTIQNGFSLVDWSGDTSDSSTDSVLVPADQVLHVRGSAGGTTVTMFGTQVASFSNDDRRTYTLEYVNGFYDLYIDGTRFVRRLESSVRPNSLNIGNSVFIDTAYEWTGVDVDYVNVQELSKSRVFDLDEQFAGSSIDTGTWDTSNDVEGVRWCAGPDDDSDVESSGTWLDPTTTACFGTTVVDDYGDISVSGGKAHFSADVNHNFPFLKLDDNPFPTSGDFSVDLEVEVTSIAYSSAGLVLGEWAPALTGDDPPGQAGVLKVWMAPWSGYYQVTLLGSVLGYYNSGRVSLDYEDGKYYVSVDGVIVNPGGTASSQRPSMLWVGNPRFTDWTINDRTDFDVNYIRVSHIDAGSPTPSAPSSVKDGASSDIDWQTSTSSVNANWSTVTLSGDTIDSYDWCLTTTTGDCSSPVDDGTTSSTSFTQSGLTLTGTPTYYVCVRAHAVSAGYGNYRCSDGFGVDVVAPSVPTLTAPADTSSLGAQVDEAELEWDASMDAKSGVDHYEYKVALEGLLGGASWNSTPDDSTSTTYEVAVSGTYEWQVRAVDKLGNASAASSTWTFVASLDPDAPTIAADGTSIVEDIDATRSASVHDLIWSSVAGADSYDVCITTTTCASGDWVNVPSGETHSFTGLSSSHGAVRVACVRTKVGSDVSSATCTDGELVDLHGVTAPTDGAFITASGGSYTLDWTEGASDSVLDLQEACVSSTATPTCDVVSWTSVTGASKIFTGLTLADDDHLFGCVRSSDGVTASEALCSDGAVVDGVPPVELDAALDGLPAGPTPTWLTVTGEWHGYFDLPSGSDAVEIQWCFTSGVDCGSGVAGDIANAAVSEDHVTLDASELTGLASTTYRLCGRTIDAAGNLSSATVCSPGVALDTVVPDGPYDVTGGIEDGEGTFWATGEIAIAWSVPSGEESLDYERCIGATETACIDGASWASTDSGTSDARTTMVEPTVSCVRSVRPSGNRSEPACDEGQRLDDDAPVLGDVVDGIGEDLDETVPGDINVSWDPAVELGSGVTSYEVCLAEAANPTCATLGGVVSDWDDVGDDVLSATFEDPALTKGIEYHACVRATDLVGHIAAEICSDGFEITDPLTLEVPPLSTVDNTSVGEQTAFLYTGSDPVQTGVTPGAIDEDKAGVYRGRVVDTAGDPLSGATISVLGHPEVGETESRSDGFYDIAVNGGSSYTIVVAKSGFPEVQRTVELDVSTYATIEDIALTPYDAVGTAVTFGTSAPFAVAESSPVTDADGTRQLVMMFKAGTQAALRMPNGSTSAATDLTVRSTEYTTGDLGPEAMPAEIASNTGYMYAAEWSADEAIAVGAASVEFDRPVITYMENFLGFAVGSAIPMGYYDRAQARWIPQPDGIVIGITGIIAGVAQVDVDNDGLADNGTSLLDDLGFDTDELTELGSRYWVSATLWRTPTTHFSPHDKNAYTKPATNDSKAGDPSVASPTDNPDCESGSIIDCQNQVLGEGFKIPGTDLSLTYRSDRVLGREEAYTVKVPITGAVTASNFESVKVTVNVMGQVMTRTVRYGGSGDEELTADQTLTFVWNGRDGYGRRVWGSQQAVVAIEYHFAASYLPSLPNGLASFGQPASSGSALGVARDGFVKYVNRTVNVGVDDARAHGLGGWMISGVDRYDMNAQRINPGDGPSRSGFNGLSAGATPMYVRRAVGTSDSGASTAGASGLSGRTVKMPASYSAPGPNKSVLVGDTQRVLQVETDGSFTTVVGATSGTSVTDGAGATSGLAQARDVTMGRDDRIYWATSNTVYYKDDGGIARSVGTVPSSGGWSIAEIEVRSDGTVFALASNSTIRKLYRVVPNETSTVVFGGCLTLVGCASPVTATDVYLSETSRVTRGAENELVVVDKTKLYRIPNGGEFTTETIGRDADSVAVDANGVVWFTGRQELQASDGIFRHNPDGTYVRVAGGGTDEFEDGEYATAGWALLNRLIVQPDGTMYATRGTGSPGVTYQFGALFPTRSADSMDLPDDAGATGMEFTSAGRLLRRYDAVTDETSVSYDYDSIGRAEGITDAFGNTTTITRASDGRSATITSPDGVETELTIGADGMLSRIELVGGRSASMGYTDTGLLESLTDLRGKTHGYEYAADGRLTVDDPPGPERITLERLATPSCDSHSSCASEVVKESALGRSTRFWIERPADDEIRYVERPDESYVKTTRKPDGTIIEFDSATAVTTTTSVSPDPIWGAQATYASNVAITGSASYSVAVAKEATDAPGANATFTATVTRAGFGTWTSEFDAAAHTQVDTDNHGVATTVTYDSDNELVTGVERDGRAATEMVYDGRGRIEELETGAGLAARTTAVAWATSGAEEGLPETLTDALGRTSTFTYDANRFVTKVQRSGQRAITSTYDDEGLVTASDQVGGRSYEFERDDNARGTGVTRSSNGSPVDSVERTLNDDAQVTAIDRAGTAQDATFTYLTDGRLQEAEFGSDDPIVFDYDGTSKQLSEADTPDVAIDVGRSKAGIANSAAFSGSVSGTVSATMSNDLLPTEIKTVRGGNTYTFSIGRDSATKRIESLGGTAANWDAVSGDLEELESGSLSETFSVDEFGAVDNIHLADGSTHLYDRTLTHDKLGRIVTATDTVGTVWSYFYDADDRLDHVNQDGVLYEQYSYDDRGNRIEVEDSSGTRSATFDSDDRLMSFGSDVDYDHDSLGRVADLHDGPANYELDYDGRGNLIGAAGDDVLGSSFDRSYVVDAFGRRVAVKDGGNLTEGFLYLDQLRPSAWIGSDGNVKATFLYLTGRIAPDVIALVDGTKLRVIQDERGSVVRIVRASDGAVMQSISYDPWGRVLSDDNPGYQPFGYAGGITDQATGLVHFGAREYHPTTGTFLTRDPIEDRTGDPYGYASSDPVNGTDPTGLCAPGDSPQKCAVEATLVAELEAGVVGGQAITPTSAAVTGTGAAVLSTVTGSGGADGASGGAGALTPGDLPPETTGSGTASGQGSSGASGLEAPTHSGECKQVSVPIRMKGPSGNERTIGYEYVWECAPDCKVNGGKG